MRCDAMLMRLITTHSAQLETSEVTQRTRGQEYDNDGVIMQLSMMNEWNAFLL